MIHHRHPALRWLKRGPTLRVETLALIVSLWFTLACNPLFWEAIMAGREAAQTSGLFFGAALAITVTALHFMILALLANRWTAKPILTLLIIATAFAAYYMRQYHVYLDPSMLRNVLRTDTREAAELFTWGMLPPLIFYALPPLLLVWWAQIKRTPLLRAAGVRTAALVLAALSMGGSTLLVFQEFSALMRQKKEIRYLVTPGNYLYSLGRTLGADATAAGREREPIGTDAAPGERWKQRKKPVLIVLVVGETARAANWGLSGYSRQTTPELAKISELINFAKVTACGTNTEVSVPRMFSVDGRRNYDEDRIRNSESLLHVIKRAGFRVVWLDNQSGCKGTCDGIESWRPSTTTTPKLCNGDNCLDEALLTGARQIVEGSRENLVLVMHQLGNHGPAYFKRYPEAFRKFTPTCDTSDLGRCSREEVVNAYDNALLYTDHVLAQTVDFLKAQQATHDTAMIYVSDHGESLGERGLFLHGVPYSIAPDVQTEVPMVMWFSPGYASSFALRTECVRQRGQQPATHDNLFHTLLGMLDINTKIRDRQMDLTDACKSPRQ